MIIGFAEPVGVFGQVVNLAHPVGQRLQRGGIIQGFKPGKRRKHVRRTHADPVVFQNGDVAALGEHLADVFAQFLAAGHGVSGHPHVRANAPHGGQKIQIRRLAHDGQGHQRRGMGVKHGLQIGPHAINGLMEGQFGRGPVRAFHRAVGMDADNVPAGQGALVHAGGGNPKVAVVVHDGEVSAGHGGHSLVVNSLHEHDQLICRMDIFDVQNPSLLLQEKFPPEFGLSFLFLRRQKNSCLALRRRLTGRKKYGKIPKKTTQGA